MSFMPSALTSLSGASGDTLEQILIAREQQRLMQQQQMEQARKMAMEDARLGLQFEGNRRAERGDARAESAAKLQAEETQRRRDRDATSDRAALNKVGVLNMAREAATRGTLDPMNARFMAVEAGAPMTAFDAPKKEETPEARNQRLFEESKARAAGSRAGNPPKGTSPRVKVLTDDRRFEQTIANRVGAKGYTTPEEAWQDIESRWLQWRKDYPGLTRAGARSAVQNAFGKRLPGDGSDMIANIVRDAMKQQQDPDDPEP